MMATKTHFGGHESKGRDVSNKAVIFGIFWGFAQVLCKVLTYEKSMISAYSLNKSSIHLSIEENVGTY